MTEYTIFKDLVANQCLIHEIENNFATPSAIDKSQNPQYDTLQNVDVIKMTVQAA